MSDFDLIDVKLGRYTYTPYGQNWLNFVGKNGPKRIRFSIRFNCANGLFTEQSVCAVKTDRKTDPFGSIVVYQTDSVRSPYMRNRLRMVIVVSV